MLLLLLLLPLLLRTSRVALYGVHDNDGQFMEPLVICPFAEVCYLFKQRNEVTQHVDVGLRSLAAQETCAHFEQV